MCLKLEFICVKLFCVVNCNAKKDNAFINNLSHMFCVIPICLTLKIYLMHSFKFGIIRLSFSYIITENNVIQIQLTVDRCYIVTKAVTINKSKHIFKNLGINVLEALSRNNFFCTANFSQLTVQFLFRWWSKMICL